MDDGGGELGPDQPLVGWRYWQLSHRGRLRSVTQKWVEWVPGEPMRATCVELHHPAPADDCNCGIYASRSLEVLREHGLCLVPEAPVVVGEVALWGRVLAGDGSSWRGERGAPRRLSLVAGTLAEGRVADAVAGLAVYEVPVDVVPLDDAVAGASATMLRLQAMSIEASRTWAE